MEKHLIKKGLVLAIILLFITVSFQPVLASDIILSEKKSDTKELLETIKDLADNKEIQSIIQKSEINGSSIRFQQLLDRLLKEIIGVIETNNVLNRRIKQLSDLPCNCERNSNPLWYPKLLCGFLFIIAFMSAMWYLFHGGSGRLMYIIVPIMELLHCPL